MKETCKFHAILVPDHYSYIKFCMHAHDELCLNMCPTSLQRPWKFEHMGIGFLSLLLRDDHPLPVPAVRFLVQSLNHDALVVRKVSGLGS